MKTIKKIGLALMAALFLFSACDIENEPYLEDAESEKAILCFDVDTVVGVIDVFSQKVTLSFPQGVDLSHLTPTIVVSPYATIRPESGVTQDFTNPVTYTVTAFDGSTADYQVSAAIVDLENEKSILSFIIEDPECEGVINEEEKTISLAYTEGTDVTHLVPLIEVSEGATVEPASGVAQDFSNPVVYTVTAMNGTTSEYIVSVLIVDEPWVATGKTVLIKDFTGVRCSNCPNAADYAHNLQHQLGEDRVFILSVHAGYLAQPAGAFPNFTTVEGTSWYGNSDSNPLFNVDYVGLDGGHSLFYDQLDGPVVDALNEEQSFEIRISNTYDAATRKLDVVCKALALEDQDGAFNITVCLVEDHITGMQITMSGLDQNYDFRNVFRGTLNGADGDVLFNGQISQGQLFNFDYSTVLNPDFNEDECYLLVYVSDKNQGGKILQSAMRKIR